MLQQSFSPCEFELINCEDANIYMGGFINFFPDQEKKDWLGKNSFQFFITVFHVRELYV